MAAGSYHSMLFVCELLSENDAVNNLWTHRPIMHIHCFPIGIIAWIECATVNVELIAEHEL